MPDQIPDDSAHVPDYSDAPDSEAAAALESYLVSDDVETSEVDGVTTVTIEAASTPGGRAVTVIRG